KIEEASVLDKEFMKSLGQFDVVYSWGVLHHTGNLWAAMENAQERVTPGGKFFIALYNDTGSQSARWFWVKKTYNSLPGVFCTPARSLKVGKTAGASSLLVHEMIFRRRSMRRNPEIQSWCRLERPSRVALCCR